MTEIYCWSDGQWLDHWPLQDRGLQYGDGLFETMRLCGQPGTGNHLHQSIPLWSYHRKRLQAGIQKLAMPGNCLAEVEASFSRLPGLNKFSALKLIVTRGVSARGYACSEDNQATIQWQLSQAPEWRWGAKFKGLNIGVNPVQLGIQPCLAGIKHLNRLEQVLARAQFHRGWDESLMLDTSGVVVEGCMSNVFWFKDQNWYTPELDQSGVQGVIRRWFMDQLEVRVQRTGVSTLKSADAIVMTNAMMGIAPVSLLEERMFDMNHVALVSVRKLQQQLEDLF
ncbi:MAG: aminodeoxychorismate lyase [Oceanobacter sp.]